MIFRDHIGSSRSIFVSVVFLFVAAISIAKAQTLPDLEGWDGRSSGYSSDYFDCQQTSSTWGQTIGVKMSVINNGPADAGAFNVFICISKTNTFTYNAAGCYVIAKVPFSSLAAGHVGAYSTYQNIQLPSTNPFGDSSTTFYVGMIVNGDRSIAEANYTNDANQGVGIDTSTHQITVTGPVPQMSVVGSTPPGNNLQFGSIAVDGSGGSLGTQTVTITNNGSAPLSISGISVTGSAAFSVTSVGSTLQTLPVPNTYPGTIQGNGEESWLVTVTYDPTAVGSQTGTLTITSNDPTHPTTALTLSGTGIAVPHLVFSDPIAPNNDLTTDYGSVVNDGAGGTSETETFTLTNTGSGPLTISKAGITLTSTQSGVWSIVSVSSNTQSGLSLTSLAAAAQTIAANGVETWQVVVKFDPIANTIGGTQYQTSLQVVSNDPTQSTLDCTLTGNGVIPMTLTVASSVNGVNDSNPLVMNFASLHATGHQSIAGTVTLTNSGQLPLVIAQNGITLASGTNFQITGITSTTQANINLSSGTATIAPSATETWTISLLFQPTAAGTDNTTLTILSNDPTHGTEPIALNGTGLNQPGILVTTPKGGTNLPFGMVLNDGAAGHVGTQSFTITNIGLQTLTVAHNGIFLTNATGYALQSIVSSTAGSISLASSSATIAPNSAETWTVVVSFDPTANTSSTGTLTISSNDPVTPSTALALTGSGTTPTITLQPSSSGLPILYIPAGQVYNVSYTATDTADTSSTATITLSTSAGNSLPATGLSTITSIPYNASTNSYSWRPSTSLVGQEVYVYGAIQDGSVSAGSYSSQKIHIEPANSFNLLTTLETTSSAYTYQYTYNGTVYSGTQTLQPGTNVVSITTPLPGGGNATHQVTVTLVNSLQSAQSVTYDELNRLKTATNGNGITTSYSYDLGGDLLQTSASNGDAISYTYDNLKRKISMTDYTGTYFYDYDDLDRQTDVIFSTSGNKTDSANLTLSYQYDNANRVTDMVYPGGEHVVFTWDDGGRLKTVSDVTKSQLTTYNYDYTTGLLQSVQRANGTTTTYTYDGSARLDDIKNKLGSTVLSEYNYTLNASGNATSLLTTFANGSQKQEQYTYDGLNRLVQVIYGSSATASPNDKTVIFAYDGSGNCLTITTKVNGSVTAQINRSYSKQNQLTTVTDLNNNPVASYFYDSAGNRIQKVTPNGTTYYTYDERNLLTSVLSPDHYVTYGYNGLGVRVSQTLDGVTTDFVVDSIPKSFQVVQERVSGAITRSYVYGNDRLNCNPVTGSASYYLPDRLGSVRQITDPSGNITSTFAYDVYGNPQ